MPLKTKSEDQLIYRELVVCMFSTKLAELTLFWFCFNCVNFKHILLSKYLAFQTFDPQNLLHGNIL